jgi:hypothetical protein
MFYIVARAARLAALMRKMLAAAVSKQVELMSGSLDTPSKWICWALLTGAKRRPGVAGECPKMQPTGAFAECCAHTRKTYLRCLAVVDAVVGAMYEYDDAEFLGIANDLRV